VAKEGALLEKDPLSRRKGLPKSLEKWASEAPFPSAKLAISTLCAEFFFQLDVSGEEPEQRPRLFDH
jgi:hypothetical protein